MRFLSVIGFLTIFFQGFCFGSECSYGSEVDEIINNVLATDCVRVLGLGESCHGSHNINVFRKEVSLEILAKGKLGYIGIEERPQVVAKLNNYVLGAPVDVDSVFIKDLFWLNKHTELYGLVQQIKVFNDTTSLRKVQLFGVSGFYNRKEYERLSESESAYSQSKLHKKLLNIVDSSSISPKKKIELLKSNIAHIDKDSLHSLKVRYDALALIHGYLYSYTSKKKRIDLNDLAIFEKIVFLNNAIKGERNSINVIWAHNGHLQVSKKNRKSAGYMFRELLGGQYKTLGIDFCEGEFAAVDFEIDINNEVTYSNKFFKLKNITRKEYGIYYDGKFLINGIGAMYNETIHLEKDKNWYKEKVKVSKEVDILVLLKESEPLNFIEGFKWKEDGGGK